MHCSANWGCNFVISILSLATTSLVEYNFSSPSVNTFLFSFIYFYLSVRTSLKSSSWSKNVFGVISTFLLSSWKYSKHNAWTRTFASVHSPTKPSLLACGSILMFTMNFLATVVKASSLQLLNQSIVQQLIKDGNLRDRTRRLSPAGLIQSTVCKFDRILEIKNDQSDSGLSIFLALIACGLTLFMISSIYSFFLNKLGTSPVLSMLLMLYRKSS